MSEIGINLNQIARPLVLTVGAVGIVHGWVWVWGIMHRKWTSPLRALLIGVTSIILGFLALGWGLRHTDPVLSSHLIPFYERVSSIECGGWLSAGQLAGQLVALGQPR
jgi:drug/metabolite transporter (DMT)-like permease